MATVSTEAIGLAGLNATYNAASAGGDKFTPTDKTLIHAKNGSGSQITVTIVTPGTSIGGAAIADLTVDVPAGEDRFIAPFPANHFAASDGLADLTWSATTSVTFAVLRI